MSGTNGWVCARLYNLQTLMGLGTLKTINDGWMEGCGMLQTLNFIGLENLYSVGDYWMSKCPMLYDPRFQGLSSLNSVGDNWMYDCQSLRSLVFVDLGNIRTFESNWMEMFDLLWTRDAGDHRKQQSIRVKYNADLRVWTRENISHG